MCVFCFFVLPQTTAVKNLYSVLDIKVLILKCIFHGIIAQYWGRTGCLVEWLQTISVIFPVQPSPR